jgi:hypothetical protein
MASTFKVGLLGLAITLIIAFSLNNQYSDDGLRVTGYEQNEYSENSCGNGILPENVPCENVDNNAKGEKNIITIEGIVFP